jgi:hypothetical protein
VTEHDSGTELQQAFGLDRGRRGVVDAEMLGGVPDQCRVAGRFGRRHQQQAPGLRREATQPPPEARFDASRQGDRDR